MKLSLRTNQDKVVLSALSAISNEIAADVLRRLLLVAPSPGLGIIRHGKSRQRMA
jgi:hypothetical protein